jgi:hypothetical protein
MNLRCGWMMVAPGRYTGMYIASAAVGFGAVAIALAFSPFPGSSHKLKEAAT